MSRKEEPIRAVIEALEHDAVLGDLMARESPRPGYFNGLSAPEPRLQMRARLRRLARSILAVVL
jgi:hypothetical protein